ncbi:MAG: hypothetical protein R3F56_20790 [Planctomycetota bacterium]
MIDRLTLFSPTLFPRARFPSVALTAALTLCAPLAADEGGTAASPYGTGTTSSLGAAPQAWIRGGPNVGNAAFQFTLTHGRPGAFAACVLATGKAAIPFAGGTLLLDPTAAYFGVLGFTTLSPAGEGAVPFPIPRYAGLDLYTQWVFVDPSMPGGLGLSDGVRITIRDSARALAVGSSRVFAYDLPNGPLATAAFGQAELDLALSPDGQLAMTIGPNGRQSEVFTTFDTTTWPPVQLTARALVNGNLRILVHPSGQWAYVPRMMTGGVLAMDRMDIDRNSASFGNRVATVSGLPTLTNMALLGASISASGNRVVLAASDLNGLSRLVVVDVDPTSPTRDQHLATYDVSVPLYFMSDAEVAADGLVAYVVHGSLAGGGGISRVSLSTGAMTRTTPHTEVVPTDLDIDPRGRYLLCVYGGSRSVGVIDLQPGSTYFQQRLFPTTVECNHMALSPDGEQIVVTGNLGNLYGHDVASGAQLWSATTGTICRGVALR